MFGILLLLDTEILSGVLCIIITILCIVIIILTDIVYSDVNIKPAPTNKIYEYEINRCNDTILIDSSLTEGLSGKTYYYKH
jgi:hypothetical protein